MILIIDNYDSFVYNLEQRLGELDSSLLIQVVRNDALTLQSIAAWQPTHIIISPGPKAPGDAGISNQVIRCYASKVPILGVCLGHQCIGEVFGGRIVRASRVIHGKTSLIYHDQRGLFLGLPNPFEAARYHSLVVDRSTWQNDDLEICAWTDDGIIMGLRHRNWPLHGVQFHPESFLTAHGPQLLANFLALSAIA